MSSVSFLFMWPLCSNLADENSWLNSVEGISSANLHKINPPKYFRKIQKKQTRIAKKNNIPFFPIVPTTYEIEGQKLTHALLSSYKRRMYIFDSSFVLFEYRVELKDNQKIMKLRHTDIFVNEKTIFSEAIAIKKSMCKNMEDCTCSITAVSFLASVWFIKGKKHKFEDIANKRDIDFFRGTEFYFKRNLIAINGEKLKRPRHPRDTLVLFLGFLWGIHTYVEEQLRKAVAEFDLFKSLFFARYYWGHKNLLLSKNAPNLQHSSLGKYILKNILQLFESIHPTQISRQAKILLVELTIPEYMSMKKHFSEAPHFPYPELYKKSFGMALVGINFEKNINSLSDEAKKLLNKIVCEVKEKLKEAGEAKTLLNFHSNYAFSKSKLMKLAFGKRGGGYEKRLKKLLNELTSSNFKILIEKEHDELKYKITSAGKLYFLNPDYPYIIEIVQILNILQERDE